MNLKKIASLLIIAGVISAFLAGCAKQREQYRDYKNVKDGVETIDKAAN